MVTAGIDIGSISVKAAMLHEGKVLGTLTGFTGYNAAESGRKIFTDLLDELGMEEASIERVVSTGYGRNAVKFAHKSMTEIICHGAGAFFTDARVRSIIDIGGQDSKAILLDDEGRVKDFAMNDKCAAGTGRFLEVMARVLESNLDEFGTLCAHAGASAPISSLCTVFAESEVISLIAKGEPRANIVAGIHESVASRVSALARKVGVREPVMMTGGVAKNPGIVKALEERLGLSIIVHPTAQVNGAIGAAVLARGV
ncbi:MAG: 2-hydroxyglutaryl-CoA dehydratase [Spirochaetes bacterium]|nr:MAG: 2-hydroxyglutaryl-CoA dehydratase [Spirochaetota bacterium]